MMIQKTNTTPFVSVDMSLGKITLKGRSSPISSMAFYNPVIEEICESITSRDVAVNLELKDLNTSSCKCLMSMFKTLKKVEENGYRVVVNWYVEEDDFDMIETGEDFEGLTELKFQYIYLK